MKPQLDNYKNIDKSTHLILNEKHTFKVFHFNNLTEENQRFKYKLHTNYIQLYFSVTNTNIVAFNFEHCAVNLNTNDSSMVYFKDEKMNILFNIQPKSELVSILISIDHFHSLFSENGNFLFNFGSFNVGKPIIETRKVNSSVKIILNQIIKPAVTESLKPVFIKGKIYELLSFYFSNATEENSDHCPYVPSEEIVGKIKHAKEIIIEQMTNPPSLDELAKKVGLNIKKLKTDFKEYYGVPVFTFLLNYKMELAKNMLRENQYNVNEIATHLGYSTSSHFIAAFKRKYGITPKQYAKS